MPDETMVRIDDLWEGEMRSVEVLGIRVLLAKVGGEVFAFEDRCPHKGVPLSKGELDGERLTCSAHGWCFNLCDGRGVNPDSSRLRGYKVRRIKDDIIAIDVSSRISERYGHVT